MRRRAAAVAVMVAGLMAVGVTTAQASPWPGDWPPGPCPYAGCDDWQDWLQR